MDRPTWLVLWYCVIHFLSNKNKMYVYIHLYQLFCQKCQILYNIDFNHKKQ